MDKSIIEKYKIIPTNQLVRTIKEGNNNSERFCFILGAGASASSNIPTGVELEGRWMAEMEKDPGFEEIRPIAKNLRDSHQMDTDFKDIENAWEAYKSAKTSLPSEFYFDIYKLRFFPNYRNGYHYLEKVMTGADVRPSFGYHPLALMLTKEARNNLVITTNFDSLIEDALFLYTNKKPLVINHELLADFVGDPNITRPIIAKVHRGIFFDPLNRPEETNELKGKWHDVLVSVFQSYTPIVIGYGGGDNSLMELLAEENVRMKNGMYWCYLEEYGLPNEKIQRLVKQKKGYLVRTAGFDATMLAIGNALFPDRIGVHETEEYLTHQTTIQISNYEKEYLELTKRKETKSETSKQNQKTQSENEFRKEIEKITERGAASEKNREKTNQMTAWDYRRQGDRYYILNQYEQAIECYTKAIEKQPDTALFYHDRGYTYDDLKQYELAIADYSKAIELNPNHPEAYNNRGYSYIHLKKYDQAIADFNIAMELDPNFANPYTHCGTAWMKKGDLEKAIQLFSKAIELNPDYKDAYLERAEAYRLIGETAKAQEDEAVADKL